MEYFAADLKEEWALMRQKNFTLDNIMKYVYDEQISVIPAKYYNDDAQVKYLDFGSLYTYCCHGSKEHLIRRWIRERLAYVDSMLEYFTSQHEQIIMRMNKTGEVSFDVTSYIPLYFSVKWSNAQGGTQTIKVERNKPVTFKYNSTTSTDQEVIVYHSHYVKRLDNLSNLNLSSCQLANASKLTEVEIHSPLLYNINVTENKFLRKLDLNGCTALGTVTAVGTTLDLSKCNYLKYVDTYGTSLTEVIFNTAGGSLREVYYPKTIQSLSLIKQPLIETLGLPYGSNGEEIPSSLYTVNIQDCTSISKLNTSTNNSINTSMASMVYCNNLTLRNSLDLDTLSFTGFKRLKNVIVENIPSLTKIGFDDMLEVGQQATIGYIGLSNCPNVTNITMNCSNNSYEITFLDNAIVDVGKLSSLKTISSNCVIKGLKTLIVPRTLEDLDFTLQYGIGKTSISNIWVSDQCNVDTSGSTVKATHVSSGYEGIDFKNMNIKTLNMSALHNVINAINFNISPTVQNPNMNTERTENFFQPRGTINLDNYTGDFKYLLKGVDLDKLNVVLTVDKDHTDITGLFESCLCRNKLDVIKNVLSHFPAANIMKYLLRNTNLLEVSGLSFGDSSEYDLEEFFANSMVTKVDLTTLNGKDIDSIVSMFKGCDSLVNLTMPIEFGEHYSNALENCSSLEDIDWIGKRTTSLDLTILNAPSFTDTDILELINENLAKVENEVLILPSANNSVIGLNEIFAALQNGWSIAGASVPVIPARMNNFVTNTNADTIIIELTNDNYSARLDEVLPYYPNCSTLYLYEDGSVTSLQGFMNVERVSSIGNIKEVTFMEGYFNSLSDLINAFRWHQGLKKINNIPRSVTKFQGAFWECGSLNCQIDLSKNSIIDGGLQNTFKGCGSLSYTPTLPSNYKGTMASCFQGCRSLIEAPIIPNGVTNMSNCFYNCSALTTVYNIPSSCTNFNACFRYCTSLISVPTDGWQGDMSICFADCTSLNQQINIESATNLSYTFQNCSSLSITPILPSTYSGIMTGCFSSCSSLAKAPIVPSGTTSMDSCFLDCSSLNTVPTIPEGVTSMTNCFKNCISLELAPNIPNSCTNIVACFYNCSKLRAVTIPLHVNAYGNCLYNCIALKDITWEGERTSNFYITSDGLFAPSYTEADVKELISHLGKVSSATLFLGSYGSYLTPDEVFIADRKGWTVDGVSSDFLIIEAADDVSGFATDENVTLVFIELTKDNYKTRVNEILKYYPNCTDLYFFEDGNITSLEDMFRPSNIFNNLDQGNNRAYWRQIQKIIYVDGYFEKGVNMQRSHQGLKNLVTLRLPNSATNMAWAFELNTSLETIIGGIPSTITTLQSAFTNSLLNQQFDLSNLTLTSAGLSSTFQNCSKLTYPPILPSGYKGTMQNCFQGCSSLASLPNIPDGINNLSYTFQNCSSLTTIPLTIPSSVTSLSHCFNGCTSLIEVDVSNWNVDNVTDMVRVFAACSKITAINGLTNLNTEKVKNFEYLFNGCSSLTSVDVTNLVTATATNLNGLFENCSQLTEIIGLDTWDTSNVEILGMPYSYSGIFSGCSSLPSLEGIYNWNVGKVKNSSRIFTGCSSLTTLDLSNWDTGNMTSAYAMFSGCSSLITLNVTGWNTSKITGMDSAFRGLTNLTTIIGMENWDTSKVDNLTHMYNSTKMLDRYYIPLQNTTKNYTYALIGAGSVDIKWLGDRTSDLNMINLCGAYDTAQPTMTSIKELASNHLGDIYIDEIEISFEDNVLKINGTETTIGEE